MKRSALAEAIQAKGSFLCVGLDSDIDRIPAHLKHFPDPVFEFNKRIIDATAACCVSYKINTAFYESRGLKGWESLERTLHYIPEGIFTIADAKRGDIGNTARHYARTFFEALPFHAVTVSPYMGEDSVRPFLEFEDKWTILLGLTSNPGAADFELLQTTRGREVYKEVIEKCAGWGSTGNTMFVVGATRAEQMSEIRELIPDHFLLVPGIGAQGGDLEATVRYGKTADIGLLINSSREILFASGGEDFDTAAGEKARAMQAKMREMIRV